MSHFIWLRTSFVTFVHVFVINWNISQPVVGKHYSLDKIMGLWSWDPYFVGDDSRGVGFTHMNPKQKITFLPTTPIHMNPSTQYEKTKKKEWRRTQLLEEQL